MKFKKMKTAALFSTAGMTIFSALQIVAALTEDSFLVYEGLMFMVMFSLGFIFPSGTTLGMTEGKGYVGAASAVLGASGFAFGGIVSPLVGLGDMILTSGCIMCGCALLARWPLLSAMPEKIIKRNDRPMMKRNVYELLRSSRIIHVFLGNVVEHFRQIFPCGIAGGGKVVERIIAAIPR